MPVNTALFQLGLMRDFGDFILVVGIIALIFIAIRSERRTRLLGPVESREVTLERKVEDLRKEIDRLQVTVETLTKQLVAALEKIRVLEDAKWSASVPHVEKFALPELLVIFGSNQAITARDKSGLGQEGIDFESINQATRAKILEELAGRREDRRRLRWAHISSDAGPLGIALVKEDGALDVVEPEWWRQSFDDLEVLMIAACQGTRVATQMAGLATWLVYFREGVDNNDAGAFAGAFWGEVVCGTTPDVAYAKARQRIPNVRNFVALRHREV